MTLSCRNTFAVTILCLLAAGTASRVDATTVTFQQGTAGYSSASDTFIDAGAAAANNSGSTTLVVDLSPSKKQALIRFGNLFVSEGGPIPDGATITSATLRVVVGATLGTAQQVGFHRMKAPWAASDNWNTFGASPWNATAGIQLDNVEANITADVSSTIPDGVTTVSVTSSLQAWIANPSLNFGWVLDETADDSVTIASCEGSTIADRPLLTVNYDAPTSCVNAGDCNDANPCTIDSCDNSVCVHTPVACGWGTCNPANGLCQVTLTFQTGVSGYAGTVDTYLDEANPALSHATDTAFFMDNDPTDKQGLLRFDGIFGGTGASQIPPGSTIHSATLTVNVNDASDTGALLHRMLKCWQDSNTWTTFGSGIQADGIEAVATADATAVLNSTGSLVIPVTNSVAAWSAGAANLGWALLPGGAAGFAFDSAQGTIKPVLSVTFTPPSACVVNADCDDSNGCTDDVCNVGTGFCSNTPNPGNTCSDSVSCTTDSCDSCGICNSVDNCTPPSVCNTTSGQCESPPSPPNQPTGMSPANNSTGVTRNPQLCVDVSDPNGGVLDVTFRGRAVTTGGGGQVFTIIALPDTQFYSQSFPAEATAQMNWIRDNRVARNIVAVTELGDCVNDADQAYQWTNANAAHLILENPTLTGLTDGIPYGVAVGNHDQFPMGAARSGADENATTTAYNATFPKSRFATRAYHGGNYALPGFADSMDNHYELFTASGMDFIVFHLEWDEGNCTWPSDGSVPAGVNTCQNVLLWARNLLVNVYPNRRAIITTHFMGTPTGGGTGTLPLSNQGQAIVNMAKGTPNVFMCLGGHLDQADSRTDIANDGHTIYTFVSDYQTRSPNGGNGWLRIMTFDPQADTIHVETFSPSLNRFINKLNDGTPNSHADNAAPTENEFTVTYDMDDGGPFSVIGSASTSNLAENVTGQACVSWPSLDADQQYEWYVTVEDNPGGLSTTGPRWFFTTANTCDIPADCDDGNPCTDDACVDNLCQYTNNTGACADDGNPCTDDICNAGACTHPADNTNTCDDNNGCTVDACVSGDCENTYSPSAGCCNADADCDDGNPGTTDTCDGEPGGTCSNIQNTSCAVNGDCVDGNACTTDTCTGGNISSLNFDGTDDFVTMGASPSLNASTLTIEAWFKRTGTGIGNSSGTGGVASLVPLVTKGAPEADGSNLDANYIFGINTAGNVIAADFEDNATGLNHPVSGTTAIVLNTWYHAAATYDGTTWRLYLNGVLEATAVVGSFTPRSDSIQHAALGAMLTSTGNRLGAFAGRLDEVRIWNVARTQSEIAADMDQALTAGTGLIGRWNLDENTGTTATDSTAPVANGTLTNGPTWNAADKAPLQDGTCTFTPIAGCVPCSNAGQCDDSNACTIDTCDAGVCNNEPLVCDDGNPCTDDSCNPATGCVYTNNAVSCDDADDCTTNDVCAAGLCAGTPIVECCNDAGDCDDANPCTADNCTSTNAAAISFDGTDDFVTMGAASALNTTTFTVECWFNRTGAGAGNTTGTGGVASLVPLIAKYAPEGESPNNLNGNYVLGIDTSTNTLAVDFEELTGPNHPATSPTSPASNVIANNTWYHAAASYDGISWRIYLNGALIHTEVENAAPNGTSIQHFGLGTMLGSTGAQFGRFQGMLDEVRVWNYARNLTEIQAGMNAEITSGTGLLGRWGLNEGTGSTAADSTTPAENGTLTNSPTWATTNLPDLGNGGCTHTPIPGCCITAADCEDGSLCTDDVCNNGTCEFPAISCNDGSACTTDSCNPATGCVFTPINCDDGDGCTLDDCDSILGCTHEPLDCDDGDPCTVDSCQPANQAAVSMSGASQYVNVGTGSAVSNFGAGSFTIEGWVRPATNAGAANVSLFRLGRSGNFSQAIVQLLANTNTIAASVETTTTGTQVDTATGITIPLNTWSHFAAVADRTPGNQRLKLYVNGAVVSDVAATLWATNPVSSSDATVLGATRADTGALSAYFNGALDEVRLWNTARSQAQIQASMNLQITSASGLTARWGLNEGAGTTAADSVGGNTGALTGGASWINTGLVNLGSGGCVNSPIPNCCVGAADCEDGNLCTDDICNNGLCEFPAIVCNDNNACTTDSCNPATGCVFTPISCDDGDTCTVDACDSILGCTHDPVNCDDGNACTIDSCQPANVAAVNMVAGQYVTFGNGAAVANFGTGSFTIEGWFRVPAVSSGSVMSLFRMGRSGDFPVATVQIPQNTATISASIETNTSPTQVSTASVAFTLNAWTHFALVADRTTGAQRIKLFVNGALASDVDASLWGTNSISSTDATVLGANRDAAGVLAATFNGAMDEIRIWNTARSLADIQSGMNSQISSAAGLTARWGMNQGTGTSATDSVGSNHGTLVGSTWITTGLPLGAGGCVHTPINCDDGDPCTVDTCVNGICQHASSCDDGNPCTVDSCAPANAAALSFDGTNDYVTMGVASGLGTSTFTLECWFKWTGGSATASTGTGGLDTTIPLVAKGRSQADTPANLNCNYFLGIRSNKLVADFEDAAGGLNHPVAGSTTITQNVWHHAAVTFNPSGGAVTWALYLDGVQESLCSTSVCTACTTNCSINPNAVPESTSIQHFSIATALDSTGAAAGFFGGVMDEVRVWNLVRTQSQIQSAMNQELTSGTGLIGRWGLNQGSGTVAADSTTPTAENGTLTNGPVWVTTNLPSIGSGCINTPVANGTACSNGNYCDGAEVCQAGVCTDSVDPCVDLAHCDEGNDTCLACIANGECNDGNPCTSDSCVGNQCVFTPIVCNDNDACTTDSCVNGACVYTPITCNDNDPCTSDSCVNGICVYTPIVCNDNDSCTTDACVDGLCVYTPMVCNDSDACTTDTCIDGVCIFTPIGCNDNDACTSDSCVNGVCEYAPIVCNDNDTCTTDACVDGTCVYTPIDCDDNEACTTDSCVDGECLHTPIVCNDNNACTTDSCEDGVCVFTLIACNDNNPCTNDTCVDGECVYTPIACNDNNACTTDTCVNGECVFTPMVCNDNNACTNDSCVNGECVYTPIACNDNDACTTDSCVNGACVYTPIVCDDSNPCTTDTCDAGVCVNTPVADGTNCADGDFCDGIETCQAGVCADGLDPCVDLAHCDEVNDVCTGCLSAAECNDNNPCTSDTCEANSCVNSPITPPDANITVTAQLCVGSSAAATVADAGVGANYAWNITGGTINSGQGSSSIMFTATSAAGVLLDVMVTSSVGCSSNDSANVAVMHCMDVTVEIPGLTLNPPAIVDVSRQTTFAMYRCDGGLASDVRVLGVTYTTSGTMGLATVRLNAVHEDTTWLAVHTGHSLRKMIPVTIPDITGAQYTVSLVSGDLRTESVAQDGIVDIVDFAILASRWSTPVGDCTSGPPEDCDYGADVTGDGNQGTADFQAIQINYFSTSDALPSCGGGIISPLPPIVDEIDNVVTPAPRQPKRSIRTADAARILSRANSADLTGDGVIDGKDIELFAKQKRLTLSSEFKRKLRLSNPDSLKRE